MQLIGPRQLGSIETNHSFGPVKFVRMKVQFSFKMQFIVSETCCCFVIWHKHFCGCSMILKKSSGFICSRFVQDKQKLKATRHHLLLEQDVYSVLWKSVREFLDLFQGYCFLNPLSFFFFFLTKVFPFLLFFNE